MKAITQQFDRHMTARVGASRVLCIAAFIFSPLTAHAETAALQYDNNGNIIQRTINPGTPTQATTTYTYDPLNRIKSEAGPAKTQSFSYDENGNRLSDGTASYIYELTSNRMSTRLGLAVAHDGAGRLTADGTGRTFDYNQAGQLAQVKQGGTLIASYYYDGNGLRTRKVTTASAPQGVQTILYVYDQWGKIIAEVSGSGAPIRAYIWRDNTTVAQIEYIPSRKILYFETDHLNTPRAAMDETGKVVWRWESDAFGSTAPNEDADGDGVKVTVNLRLGGYQYADVESGLYYNWHRYYNPATGQFIQSDLIGLEGGINTYAYAENDPISNMDPDGLAVLICSRPADLPYPLSKVKHKWIKTDTKEAGMGAQAGVIPAQGGNSDLPFTPTEVVDHTGQSKKSKTSCEQAPKKVDEKCVNEKLKTGRKLGRWAPWNQCQSFVKEVIAQCTK